MDIMKMEYCQDCRYDERIRGQRTNICTNPAVNKRWRSKNNDKKLNDICDTYALGKPLTMWRRFVQWCWDRPERKAAKVKKVDSTVIDFSKYKIGSWRKAA